MRKFEPGKLYKLTKIFVILLMLFFAVKLIFDWNYANSYTRARVESDAYQECDNLYTPGTEKNGDCIARAKLKNYYEPTMSQPFFDFSIVLVVPILFFGGTWLYKYLFPVNKEKS